MQRYVLQRLKFNVDFLVNEPKERTCALQIDEITISFRG